jgi:hydrogenase nickel incorporation protein HypB
MKIVAAAKILKANDQLAAETRAKLSAAGIFGVNLVGSPGAGKTTLLEALLAHWKGGMPRPAVGMAPPRPAVIEGDIAGSIDAERIEKLGVPVVQINTQGACHLDASMVAAAIADFDLGAIDLLFIENVGNLVCTAGFDLGERLRILVLSTSEGDDKAAKYPAIFQSSQALCITKTDLLPQTNFDLQRITADFRRLVPQGVIFQVAALRGEGIPAAADWLLRKCRSVAP